MTADDRGAEEYSPTERWIITIVAMSGMFCMFISATIVNVAIPSVMGAFGVGQDQAQWVATAYLATMVASQLLSHWFVRAFGMRLSYVIIIGSDESEGNFYTIKNLLTADQKKLEIDKISRYLNVKS